VPEFCVLIGGSSLAGAVIAGLNPTRRGAELASDIALADCQLVITESRHLPALEGVDLGLDADRIWVVDDERYAKATAEFAHSPFPVDGVAGPKDLCMLIFTSGTSGTPKAVKVIHERAAGSGVRAAAQGTYRPDNVFYVSMPMFHGACVSAAMAPALASGGRIVLKRRFSASQFLPDVREHGVTNFHYVGKALSYVLATPAHPDDADTTLTRADGNEAADLDIARFATRFGCAVHDGFGSTEGGVGVARTPDTPAGSIGRPAPGIALLHQETSEPVPVARFDETGRLLNADEAIGEMVNTEGRGGFEGYYKNEAADAERMRGGMYWSGDLAYRDEQGFYYFAGRTIEWLRVDGENVGAAPVERLIGRHAWVSQVAVYGVPAPDAGDELMVALKLHQGTVFDPVEFERFLCDQPDLGTKWTPRYVRVATTLPETETNKVLKRVLARERWECADPVWWRDGRTTSYVALDDDGRRRIHDAFAAHGRSHVLD